MNQAIKDSKALKQPKVAIVYDWLTTMGGAERQVLALHDLFPEAPIFTSVYDAARMPAYHGLDVRTTYLQHLPRFVRYKHQLWPVLRAHAFRRLDLSTYDIVISSASAEAKAVRIRPGALHICYCHTPTRYFWSHYHEYMANPGFGLLNPLIRLIMPGFVAWLRKLDLKSVRGITTFAANSHEVQARIKKYYRRDATVIFPPVDTAAMRPSKAVRKENFYVIAGRQIPYKRTDLAVAACTRLGKRLVVIGRGSEHAKLRAMAGPTIEFPPHVDDKQKADYFQRAKAFIFPGEEDFGITPVEAMAAGTPVIAYGKGGALDYVEPGKSGLFFKEQTVDSLIQAITAFEQSTFDSKAISQHAEQFGKAVFMRTMKDFVDETYRKQQDAH